MNFIQSNSTQIEPHILSYLVQIWEFFHRFDHKFQIQAQFSLNDLVEEFNRDTSQTDLLHYLMHGLFGYVFKELIIGGSHNSNYYSIIENIQSEPVKKYLIYQTWPLFFQNLNKSTKMRNTLQGELKEEFQEISQKLQEKSFDLFVTADKIQLFLFTINWIIYEIEAFSKDMNQMNDILNEVKPKQTEKQRYSIQLYLATRKQWKLELNQVTIQIEETEEEIKSLKRKNKKNLNKKALAQMEENLENFRNQEQWLSKLLQFDEKTEKKAINSGCKMIGQVQEYQFWILDGEPQYFYLRLQEIKEDKWFQINSSVIKNILNIIKKIFQFIEYLDQKDVTSIKLNQQIQDLIQNEQIKVTNFTETVQKSQYFTIEDWGEELLNNNFNFDFFRRLINLEDYMDNIKNILLNLERDYSEYEIKYWKSCWQSKEKRQIWTAKVQTCQDIDSMQTIISKFPHQLSFVNRKHALDIIDEEIKYRSHRLYWFYQNKEYSHPYQTLAKSQLNEMTLLLLSLSLYEKLKLYINKKVNQLQFEIIEKNQSHSSSQKILNTVEENEEDSEIEQPITKRLRLRKNNISYKEKVNITPTSSSASKTNKKIKQKSGNTTPDLMDLQYYQYTSDRILRSRKKAIYD